MYVLHFKCFLCPRDDSQGALRFAPACLSVCPSVRPSVCLSVCPSVRYALRYRTYSRLYEKIIVFSSSFWFFFAHKNINFDKITPGHHLCLTDTQFSSSYYFGFFQCQSDIVQHIAQRCEPQTKWQELQQS